MIRVTCLAALAGLLLAACAVEQEQPTEPQQPAEPMTSPLGITANDCRSCHPQHYEEWEQSFHAKSVVASHGGLKKYIITEEEIKGRPLNRNELMGCLGCHAPAMRFATDAEFTRLVELVKADQRDAIAGLNVDCVACHTLAASGDYETRPPAELEQQTYYSTIQNPERSPHGAEYSAAMGTSEFCKTCHTYVTPEGMGIDADWDIVCTLTYDSWAEGPVGPQAPAGSRQQCQNCHMEKRGGQAAEMPGPELPTRRVSSHLFPGWHDAGALAQAAVLSVSTRPGSGSGAAELVVTIDNKAGHRMPDT